MDRDLIVGVPYRSKSQLLRDAKGEFRYSKGSAKSAEVFLGFFIHIFIAGSATC